MNICWLTAGSGIGTVFGRTIEVCVCVVAGEGNNTCVRIAVSVKTAVTVINA